MAEERPIPVPALNPTLCIYSKTSIPTPIKLHVHVMYLNQTGIFIHWMHYLEHPFGGSLNICSRWRVCRDGRVGMKSQKSSSFRAWHLFMDSSVSWSQHVNPSERKTFLITSFLLWCVNEKWHMWIWYLRNLALYAMIWSKEDKTIFQCVWETVGFNPFYMYLGKWHHRITCIE